MKECTCCQYSDWPVGDAPDYYQCAECQMYGTEDEFEKESEVCINCQPAAN
jgi:hypothetical protein